MITKDIDIPEIPRSRVETILEILALLGVVLSLSMVGINWSELPDRIPTHFNVFGDADSWGGKATLFILPGFIILIYALLSIAMRYPHGFNYPWPITTDNVTTQVRIARLTIRLLKVEVIWLLLTIDYFTIQTAKGNTNGLGVAFLPIALIIIFGTIAYQIYRAYKAK